MLSLTTIICGFILPRLILQTFGSEVNGLVNSIGQFLGIIGLMDLGVGAVVQSSLYKPLVDNDYEEISKIMSSASRFFKMLGRILLVYVLILAVIYPFISDNEFNYFYSASLIISMAISSFAQYYFAITNQLLLIADQKGYICYTIQIISVVLNTLFCAAVIYLGGTIQVVKFVSSIVFLIQPIYLKYYVDKHYALDLKIKYTEEPIKQKWNGIAQHVSAVVLDGTDTIVLTIFSSLSNVSIYSVYHLVVYGIKNLFTSMTNGGVQSFLGELFASQDKDKLSPTFSYIEWILHTSASFIFACTGVLIVPFVSVYTKGITDANYFQPVFGALIVAANCAHCLRLPYHIMIKAAGQYKETQNSYIIAAVMNLLISAIVVKFWGLIGVAVGTLVSMLYQTIWMAIYCSKHILQFPITRFVKQILIDIISIVVCYILAGFIQLQETSYNYWILMALECSMICGAVFIVMNMIFYHKMVFKVATVLKSKVIHSK